jgi:hypothetical protein
VALDLVGEHGGVETVDGVSDLPGLEVADADAVDQSTIDQFVERTQGFGWLVLPGGPVDVHQIDAVDAKTVQRLLRGFDHVVGGEVVYPHLRRQEHRLPADVGGGDPSADIFLVAVDLCGVDVPVPHLQGHLDRGGTLVGVCVLPGTESKHRHRVGVWYLRRSRESFTVAHRFE